MQDSISGPPWAGKGWGWVGWAGLVGCCDVVITIVTINNIMIIIGSSGSITMNH